jgi:hypothetical protein
LVRGEHGLVVLLLVLDDHAEREPVRDQPAALHRRGVEQVEDLRAHRVDIGARLRRAEQRQLRAVPARVLERVVQMVDIGPDRLAPAHIAHEPEFLLVADVGQIPDQRRHQRRVLAYEIAVVHRVGE